MMTIFYTDNIHITYIWYTHRKTLKHPCRMKNKNLVSRFQQYLNQNARNDEKKNINLGMINKIS